MVKMKSKKGIFFSSDALIALTIVFLTIAIFTGYVSHVRKETKTPSDLINVLSNIKIGELNNSYAQNLISQGKIKNLNKTVLEQIGKFYVENQTIAEELAQSILDELEINDNIGIWYGRELIASVNESEINDAKNIEVERQTISSLIKNENGSSETGFSARAYLENDVKSKYVYFGGYIGDGNITARINYSGDAENVKLEITSNEDFDVYINGNFSGHYQNSSSDFTPSVYDLSAYSSNFNSEENIIKLIGDRGSLHIAGGYLKVAFSNASLIHQEEKKYYFPGIEGLINIYDSFYLPGNLNSMDIYLHMNSSYDVFLNIGNTTLFENNTEGEDTISISNSEILSKGLDYNSLLNRTVPLRLGMKNGSYIKNITMDADVISVTDLSGSMQGSCSIDCGESEETCENDCGGTWIWFFGYYCSGGLNCDSGESTCENDCGGTWESPIQDAKDANKQFIDDVLNRSGNRVGLVGYSGNAEEENYHTLSEDNVSLKSEVDEWAAGGGTCICCGVNRGVREILDNSSGNKYRSLVVMSDGQATYYCGDYDDYTGSGTGGTSDQIDREWAINSSCNAYENHGITVHTVGFGSGADESTLQAMADCGNGNYYFSDLDNLTDIYQAIAEDILEASYEEQTIEVTDDVSVELYPDSYIEFDYTLPEIPYGLILTSEEKFYNAYEGNFSIPENSTIISARAISYSGPRWTSNTKINGNLIYNLSRYGSDYIQLGDPYSIEIPKNFIEDDNTVRVTTGLSPANETIGSEENKIIYKVIKNFVSYSEVASVSEGCIWNIEFEDGTTQIVDVPEEYSGDNYCYYNSSSFDIEDALENTNDASQLAVYDLFRKADFDLDGMIDVRFSENDLSISSSEIIGIPYVESTEVQIRRWD